MHKTFALVRRALSTDARDARPHLFRAALAGVVLCTLMMIHADSFYRGAPGLDLFMWVCFYNYWFITIAGASFFATAITEEKEERTLSLLKLAGVGSAALLIGKWIPRLLGACLLIAIQIPFTLLSVTLGGVLWDQVGAMYMALFAHLFFIGNVGLLASVLMSTSSSASGMAVLVLFLYHVLPPVLAGAAVATLSPGEIPPAWFEGVISLCNSATQMCGLWRINAIVSTSFSDPWIGFQVISNVIAGSLLLLAAWLAFGPCTRNEADPSETRWLNRLRDLGLRKRQRRAWNWPLVWKDFHYLGGGFLLLLAKFLAYAGGLLLITFIAADWSWSLAFSNDYLGSAAVSVSLFALPLEVAVLVTRLYRTEMTQQTWSTLMILPYSLPEVAYPKLLGAGFSVVPCLSTLLIGILLIPKEFGSFAEELFREPEVFLGMSYFGLQLLLGIQIACWFSIQFRWAVWPLAIFLSAFVVFMMNMMVLTCLMTATHGRNEAGGIFVLLCCKGLVLNGGLHYFIGQRLRAMAAE